jgi:glycerophosphoryl diester phosphodiesterase
MRTCLLIAIAFILLACKKDFTELEVIVSSHAGESIYFKQNQFPPNSIQGVLTVSQDTRADAVELDVQMTKDNILVLWHDAYLDENSDLTGCIGDYDQGELAGARSYGTNYEITKLSAAIQVAQNTGVVLILDVKHYNFCAETKIDYAAFNNAFNDLILDLTALEKQNIIVNCRDVGLLQALSDNEIQKSIESDDLIFTEEILQNTDIELVFIKLEEFNETWKAMLDENQAEFGLYNLNNRSNVNNALSFAPDYVISDKLEYTLNSVYGKE